MVYFEYKKLRTKNILKLTQHY